MPTVLLADSDRAVLTTLRRALTADGYQVRTAANGGETLAQLEAGEPDLVVLDWTMPDLDGLEIARRIRQESDTPILMLTTRDAVADRVEGLEAGADDYLVKPFTEEDLLARVRTLLRRSDDEAMKPLAYADLYLDPTSRQARRGQRYFNLTPREFDLFQYLLRHPGQALSRELIYQAVWDFDCDATSNALDVYIGYLRNKTEAGGEPRLIHNVRGVGYVLRQNPQPPTVDPTAARRGRKGKRRRSATPGTGGH